MSTLTDTQTAMNKMTDASPPQPVDHTWFSQAALDVTAERRRQISAEGWTPEHDDEHQDGELSAAAAAYAWAAGCNLDPHAVEHYEQGWAPPPVWPWDDEAWKPASVRRMLVKAGALILAEIERLDRAASTGSRP
jgi:hypothetical protein